MKKEITITLTDRKTGKPIQVTETLNIRIYHGRIASDDIDTINKRFGADRFNWLTTYDFLHTGEWIQNGKPVGSYQLCGLDGEVIEEFEDMQFSRTRDGIFYLECMD